MRLIRPLTGYDESRNLPVPGNSRVVNKGNEPQLYAANVTAQGAPFDGHLHLPVALVRSFVICQNSRNDPF
ncbi:MAG: hypothetical protein K2Y37_04565 [Pirellulales bacterium]|nr:hypothetical protein [Pirellulales bacterium]